MTRRLILFALVLLALPASAKRRAVRFGGPGGCTTGVLAQEAFPRLMTTDADFIYWIDASEEALYRVAKQGGAPQRLTTTFVGYPISLAVDDTHVYIGVQRFTENFTPLPSDIVSIPKSGGVLGTLISGVRMPFDLETDATHLYWAAAGEMEMESGGILTLGRIERALKNGSGRETLADDLSAPFDLALDGDAVWFGQSAQNIVGPRVVGLSVVSKSGGAVTTIDGDTLVARVVPVGSAMVVWGRTATVRNAIFVIRRDRGGVRTLVEAADLAGGLEIFDGVAYYTTGQPEEPNRLWSVPVVGGTPTLLRDDMNWTNDFAVDACAITIGTFDGALERIKR